MTINKQLARIVTFLIWALIAFVFFGCNTTEELVDTSSPVVGITGTVIEDDTYPDVDAFAYTIALRPGASYVLVTYYYWYQGEWMIVVDEETGEDYVDEWTRVDDIEFFQSLVINHGIISPASGKWKARFQVNMEVTKEIEFEL